MVMEVGCYTDDTGQARCRATGKLCLSYKEAATRTRRAKQRGEIVAMYRCDRCDTWHFGHNPVRRARRGRPHPRRPDNPRHRGW